MQKIIVIISVMLLSLCAYAQTDRPVRTVEEEARKWTQMLDRELTLDSLQSDSIYRIHLRYAKLRSISNTRQEALQRMNDMTTEILNVLNKKQREQFLNKQLDPEPRRPLPKTCRISHDSLQSRPYHYGPDSVRCKP